MPKPTLKASPVGKEKANKAFNLTGKTQEYIAGTSGTTRQLVAQFLDGRPVEKTKFIAICAALELQWQQIAELEGTETSTNNRTTHKYSDIFNKLIQEKTKDFVGRIYVFNAISDFINTNSSGYFRVIGDPGMGKSSIAAQYVLDNDCIAFFNEKRDLRNKTSQFIASIFEQLNIRYNLSLKLPDDPSEYNTSVFTALMESTGKTKDKVIIVVDALDEVDLATCDRDAFILHLPIRLPDNVFIVLTERRDSNVRLPPDTTTLSLLDPKYVQDTTTDISNYIRTMIQRRGNLESAIYKITDSLDTFISEITKKSEKNFMYLKYVLVDIEKGRYESTSLDNFPTGLMDYYKWHWERMGMNNKNTPNRMIKLRVIYHISEAYTALSLESLTEYTKQEQVIISDIIDEWIQFLHTFAEKGEELYRIYHQSFQDFLKQDRTVKSIGSDMAKKVKKIETEVLLESIYE
jgi:hypothetical protein